MATKPQIDDEDDFVGDYPGSGRRSGDKRAFGDLDEEEDGVFGSKKTELESAQSEIRKWYSAFQSGPVAPAGTNPEPELVIISYNLSPESEIFGRLFKRKAKKREAVTYAKREQEIADLKSAVRDLKKQLRPPSIQEVSPAFAL